MLHSYPWYTADWRGSRTRVTMSLAERGLFREILDELYQNGSIPDEPELIRRIVGASEREFRRSWPKVRSILVKTETGDLTHPKVQDLLSELLILSERRKRSSSTAATARWSKQRQKIERNAGLLHAVGNTQSNAPAMRDACVAHCESDAPECGPSASAFASASALPTGACAQFDAPTVFSRIWQRHPKHSDRIPAEQMFAQLIGEYPVDPADRARQIEQGHAAWCASDDWQREGGRFAPKLVNFLRSGDWAEDPRSANVFQDGIRSADEVLRERSAHAEA